MSLHVTGDYREFLRYAPSSGPRVVVADIETFPMLSYHWRMFKQHINVEQVVEDITMMSTGVKWLHQDRAFYRDQRGLGKRVRNDRRLVQDVCRILDKVDFVVAHNGERFDLRQIRARAAHHRIQPFSPVKVIDTLLLNKKQFDLSSQSLKFITRKFGEIEKGDHAKFPGFSLWLECLKDNPEAWDECETYNLGDLTTLEDVYLKLRGWYTGHPNHGPYIAPSDGDHVCPTCGSDDVRKNGKHYTQVGTYQRYTCRCCGAPSRSRLMIVGKADREHILVN